MKCEKCGKVATVHTISSINGVKEEHYLCQDCAAKMPAMAGAFSPMNFMKGFWDDFTKPFLELGGCPTCGTTWQQFQNFGRLGCSNCYTHFEEPMIPVLERMQGKSVHPQEETNKKSPAETKAEALQQQLKEAIAKEEFEQAAALRDQIRALEKKGEEK